MPKVSVIIPTFNCAAFVTRAVDSVLTQTLQDYEVIVVDDGSTDATRQVLEPYGECPRFRYLYQENRGLPGARNSGARVSRAEYLAFLDADDTLEPLALERMTAALDASGSSWCLIDIFKVSGEKRPVQRTEVPQGDAFHEILKDDFIRRGMFFRRRDFIEVGMYDESTRYREDWEINIRMLEKGKAFVYLDQPLYAYTWRESSMTTGHRVSMLAYTEIILRRHHKRLADAGDRQVAHIYAGNMWSLARQYLYELRDPQRALRCVRESLRYDLNFGRMLHPLIHHLRRLPV